MKESAYEPTSNNQEEMDDEHVDRPNAVQNAPSNFSSRVYEEEMIDQGKSFIGDGTAGVLFIIKTESTSETNDPIPTTTVTTYSPPPPSSQSPVTVLSIKRTPVCVTEEPMKIAISYSSAHRELVYKIYEMVQRKVEAPECPHPVFIDRDFQDEICRLDGRRYFSTIYNQAHLVVVFLSSSYIESYHCMMEWREIFNKFTPAGMNNDPLQLLLVKVGDYDMEKLDLKRSDYLLDATRLNDDAIAEIITKRSIIVEQKLAQK
ncbi:unnamed protein product [Adineta steineri]|uniref:TIR domain-containing protein n=1 Tax=Adineta steineri TaxID=433720 RepID=A0A819EZB6_9BILA|nr:unnamed protein product [Adineta steineri]CAF3859907.1 unnamed protein product [Adineta steineri]